MGLNHRPADYESAALPLSYAGFGGMYLCQFLARSVWGRQDSLLADPLLTPTNFIPSRRPTVNFSHDLAQNSPQITPIDEYEGIDNIVIIS